MIEKSSLLKHTEAKMNSIVIRYTNILQIISKLKCTNKIFFLRKIIEYDFLNTSVVWTSQKSNSSLIKGGRYSLIKLLSSFICTETKAKGKIKFSIIVSLMKKNLPF